MSQYQKGKTNQDFTEARDSEWQWHQLGICKSAPRSRQITTPAPHHSVFTGRMPFLPPNQQHQSTEGIHYQIILLLIINFTIQETHSTKNFVTVTVDAAENGDTDIGLDIPQTKRVICQKQNHITTAMMQSRATTS